MAVQIILLTRQVILLIPIRLHYIIQQELEMNLLDGQEVMEMLQS